MKGLLLAAGLGSRLRPLTDTIPKPLVPICGRPCIEPLLEWLAEGGLTEVAINTHWLPQKLHDHLGDGSAWGVALTWRHEEVLLDGLGTLKSFESFFGDETVVCVNADIVIDFDLAAILATHRRVGAAMTLVTVPLVGPMIHPVAWDDEGRLRAIRRAGLDDPRGRHLGVFSGVMVCEPVVWREFVPPGVPYHLSQDLCPRLLAAGVPVACHLESGLWADLGTRESLDRAHVLVLHERCQRYLRRAVEVRPGIWVEPGVEVAGELRPPVYLSAGSVVQAGAIVGPYAVIGPGAVVTDRQRLAREVAL